MVQNDQQLCQQMWMKSILSLYKNNLTLNFPSNNFVKTFPKKYTFKDNLVKFTMCRKIEFYENPKTLNYVRN